MFETKQRRSRVKNEAPTPVMRPLFGFSFLLVTTGTLISLLAQSRLLLSSSASPYYESFNILEREAIWSVVTSSSVSNRDSGVNDSKNDRCQSLPSGGPLILVWAYDQSPDAQVLQKTIESLPLGVDTRVFCGNSACWELFESYAAVEREVAPDDDDNSIFECLQVTRLVVTELAEDSPLEDWMNQHVLAKLLAASQYEDHLQVATQLLALWKYGGQVVHLAHPFLSQALNTRRTTSGDDAMLHVLEYQDSIVSSWGGLWGAAVPSRHNLALKPFFNHLLYIYNWRKPLLTDRIDLNTWPIRVNFNDFCDAEVNPYCTKLVVSKRKGLSDMQPPVFNKTFATLSYDARRTYLQSIGNPGMNLGDEMQGLAGIQFLPRLDAFLERDRLDIVRFATSGDSVTGSISFDTPSTNLTGNQKVHAFLNAWWGTPQMTWPPPEFIEPVTISMHFQPKVYGMVQKDASKKFFKENAPIGARDLKTLSVLNSQASVPALFTACMTMSLTLPPFEGTKDDILIVDVKNRPFLEKVVPSNVIDQAKFLSHKVLGEVAGNNMLRYLGAFEKLLQYRQAKLVITERLHTALPSIAMGTPVVFLDGGALIGGGGSRLEGLERFMHYIRGNETAPKGFDWFNPPANPEKETFTRYSTTIKHLAACHNGISDSARKFGMVPSQWDVDTELEVCVDRDELETSPDTIHIATVLDGNYLHTVFPSWLNALSQTNEEENLVLYLLTDNLSSKQLCLLRQITKNLLPASTVVYTLSVKLSEETVNNYRGLKHVPVATQARLYLTSLLPCVDKILWMDLDALAVGPLGDLWNGSSIPACGISARESVTDMFFDGNNDTKAIQWNKKYGKSFNAGVMLLSLDTLRENRFEESIVKYWAESRGLNDQFVYNLACNGTYGRLEQRMNVYQQYPEHTPPRNDWVIAHFQSSSKPWAGAEVEKTFQKIWDSFKISFEEAIAVMKGPRSAIRDPTSILLLPGAKIQKRRTQQNTGVKSERKIDLRRKRTIEALRRRAIAEKMAKVAQVTDLKSLDPNAGGKRTSLKL